MTENILPLYLDKHPEQRNQLEKFEKKRWIEKNKHENCLYSVEEIESHDFCQSIDSAFDVDYLYPSIDGGYYNGFHYTCHALERMVPYTEEIFKLLESRAIDRMKTKLLKVKENKQILESNWWREFLPDPRGILPIEVELELLSPGSTDLQVISENNRIISVYRTRKEHILNDEDKSSFERKAQQLEYYHIQAGKSSKMDVSYLNDHGEEIFYTLKSGTKLNPTDKRTNFEKAEAQRINGIAERRAFYVRDKALKLADENENWNDEHKKLKNKNSASVDIKAWKESHKSDKKKVEKLPKESNKPIINQSLKAPVKKTINPPIKKNKITAVN